MMAMMFALFGLAVGFNFFLSLEILSNSATVLTLFADEPAVLCIVSPSGAVALRWWIGLSSRLLDNSVYCRKDERR